MSHAPAPPRARTGFPTPLDGAARRGFVRPTVLEGLRALAAVVGPSEALRLWSESALATGAHGQDLTPGQHQGLLEHLVATAPSPSARAAAISHLTRLRAHAVLVGTDR